MPVRPHARPASASAPAPKSLQAFRSISEVAEILQVPQHVLRFWESKFVQLKPLKRRGGRRYYRLSDIELLCGVHKLLYGDRYTIEGVQKVFAQRGTRFVAELGRSVLSTSGGHIAAELEEVDAEAEAAEHEQSASSPAPAAPEGQGGRRLDEAARRRLLQALDALEEIGAALQSAAAAPEETGTDREGEEASGPSGDAPS